MNDFNGYFDDPPPNKLSNKQTIPVNRFPWGDQPTPSRVRSPRSSSTATTDTLGRTTTSHPSSLAPFFQPSHRGQCE